MIDLEKEIANLEAKINSLPNISQVNELKNYISNLSHNKQDWKYKSYEYVYPINLDATASDEELKERKKEFIKKDYEKTISLNEYMKNEINKYIERDASNCYNDYLSYETCTFDNNGKKRTITFELSHDRFSLIEDESQSSLIAVDKKGNVIGSTLATLEYPNWITTDSKGRVIINNAISKKQKIIKFNKKPKDFYWGTLESRKTSEGEEQVVSKTKHLLVAFFEHMYQTSNKQNSCLIRDQYREYVSRIDDLDIKFDKLRPQANCINVNTHRTLISDSKNKSIEIDGDTLKVDYKHTVENEDKNYIENETKKTSEFTIINEQGETKLVAKTPSKLATSKAVETQVETEGEALVNHF